MPPELLLLFFFAHQTFVRPTTLPVKLNQEALAVAISCLRSINKLSISCLSSQATHLVSGILRMRVGINSPTLSICRYRNRSPCRVTSSAGDVIALTSSGSRETMQSYQTLRCAGGCGDMTSSCVADFYNSSTTTDMLSSRSYSYTTSHLPVSAADSK